MYKIKLLNEVNNLVAVGLRKTAIDLIEEYLEKVPDEPAILRSLGRIYLLDKKPDQAVKYLQLSLKNDQSKTNTTSSPELYELDDLDVYDLQYIDENAKSPESYYIETIEEQPSKHAILDSIGIPPLSLHDNEQKDEELNQPTQTNRVFTPSGNSKNQTDFIRHPIVKTKGLPIVSLESNTNEADRSPNFISNDTTVLPYLSDSITAPENRQFDLFDEAILEEEIVEDFFEDDEVEAEFYTDIAEIDDDITEKEFSWDDLDEFDEIDDQENINTQYINEVETTGKLNRFERAKQIATDVIQTYDWGKENLSLLEQAFFENGWGMTRVLIERELNKGLTPEELELALFIRQLWSESQEFWISFQGITSNIRGQKTEPVYKIMSWPESLRIIRSFNNPPSQEEIQHFIETTYDDWYCSDKLRRQFKAFIRYLKYRTGSIRGALPGNEDFSYINSYERDEFVDTNFQLIKYSTDVLKLKQERIDIEQMLTGIEQKYAVVRPEGDFGDPAVYGDR